MGRVGRIAAGMLGALLVYGGIDALAFSEAAPAWRYLGGTALVVLGIDSLYGALTGKTPWIFRIGPVP
jgi:hypothetical protein